MVYVFNLSGNPVVPCWGRGGSQDSLHCADLATLLYITTVILKHSGPSDVTGQHGTGS